jgi:hypothetical protein
LLAWLVENGIDPTPEVIACFDQNNDKITPSTKSKPASPKMGRRDPEVAKRREIVRSNKDTPAGEMCDIFDREKVPLLVGWQNAGFKSWSQTYKDPEYKGNIQTMISRDKG